MSFIVGGIMAAGSIASGIIGANGAKNAANAQVAGANNAIKTQQQNFNTVNSEFAPNRNLGYGADNLLAQLYGIGNPTAAGASNAYPGANYNPGGPTSLPTNNVGAPGSNGSAIPGVSGASGGAVAPGSSSTAIPGTGATAGAQAGGGSAPVGGAAQNPNYSNFYNSPGFQFTLGQGQQAINRSASAAGNAYSSTTLGALNNYAQGAASTQYNNYVSQLMGLANLGQTATQGTAAAATTSANNISSAQLGVGNANASGIAGQAGAWNSAIQGVGSGIGVGSMGVGNVGSSIGESYTYNPYSVAQGAAPVQLNTGQVLEGVP